MVTVANATAQYRHWLHAKYPRESASVLSPRINEFRGAVFNYKAAHAVPGPDGMINTCAQKGWLCVLLVRDPSDRLISSFFHVALTKLGANWKELVDVVGNIEQVKVSNYTLRHHVQALQLTRRNMHRALAQRDDGRNELWSRAGAEHYLPQVSAWHDDLFHGTSRALQQAYARGLPKWQPRTEILKLVTVDDVPGGLGAVDAAFRGGRMRLAQISKGLRSNHWRSAPPDSHQPLARRSVEPRVDADSFASYLCGSPHGITAAGAKVPLRAWDGSVVQLKRGSRCDLLPNVYPRLLRAMHAEDEDLFAQVRCLFHDDYELYERRVCEQKWLPLHCPRCVAKACGTERQHA